MNKSSQTCCCFLCHHSLYKKTKKKLNTLPKLPIAIGIIFLLFQPVSGFSFNFGAIIDEVGTAVKSGIKDVKENAGNTRTSNENETEEQKKERIRKHNEVEPEEEEWTSAVTRDVRKRNATSNTGK